MDIQILREFVELMSSRSARRAARVLNLSPSTLSRHMATLEQELGVSLLEHGNRTEFTSEAYAVMPAIVDVLKAYDAVFEAIPRGNEKSRPFRVFCVEYDQLCAEVLSYALEELRRGKDIRVVEVTDVGDSLRDALVAGDIDAVFGTPVSDDAGRLDHCEVVKDSLVAWFANDSDLVRARRADGTIPMSALAGHVLPVTIDPRLRRSNQSTVEALLRAETQIRTVPIFINSYREYFSHIHDDRFCVSGIANPPAIPLVIRDKFTSAVIDAADANANRALTMRAGERSVAAIRLIAALRKAARHFTPEEA